VAFPGRNGASKWPAAAHEKRRRRGEEGKGLGSQRSEKGRLLSDPRRKPIQLADEKQL